MHNHIIPESTPIEERIAAHQAGKERAEQMLAAAQTFAEREIARCWLASAEQNLIKWRAVAERSAR